MIAGLKPRLHKDVANVRTTMWRRGFRPAISAQ
jgi:hypothetical protein